MALSQTATQMVASVRRWTDTRGVTATNRHPDADLLDAINRGLGSLHRKLTAVNPSQRYLASTSPPLSTSVGQTLLNLPADFDSLVSIDVTANGAKVWLQQYELNERAALTDPSVNQSGVPAVYRLRGSQLEVLPAPDNVYAVTLWYVPTVAQFSAVDGTAVDTISRLDDYVIAYATRYIAIQDKNWQLVNVMKELLVEITPDIETVARARDKNSPSRIQDQTSVDRWGRSARPWRGGRWT